eukprot:TRINITY_DN51388_c0_g1_i1.p1 TRINITY_DN51388_c0_g1~~TRINITY_DN51388_c0_g1_i1.p1  ORF type:complete len:393 (+),score=53.80 TRINITY_DN51388_c0_g1_i1:90-1181(+)
MSDLPRQRDDGLFSSISGLFRDGGESHDSERRSHHSDDGSELWGIHIAITELQEAVRNHDLWVLDAAAMRTDIEGLVKEIGESREWMGKLASVLRQVQKDVRSICLELGEFREASRTDSSTCRTRVARELTRNSESTRNSKGRSCRRLNRKRSAGQNTVEILEEKVPSCSRGDSSMSESETSADSEAVGSAVNCDDVLNSPSTNFHHTPTRLSWVGGRGVEEHGVVKEMRVESKSGQAEKVSLVECINPVAQGVDNFSANALLFPIHESEEFMMNGCKARRPGRARDVHLIQMFRGSSSEASAPRCRPVSTSPVGPGSEPSCASDSLEGPFWLCVCRHHDDTDARRPCEISSSQKPEDPGGEA